MRVSGGVHLLDTEPSLGEHLDPGELTDARRLLVVPAFDAPTGPLDLDAVRDADRVAGHCWGILIVSGAVLNHVMLMKRTCSRLFLPGDLMLLDGPADESIPTIWYWTVKARARIALLDDRVLAAGQRWPLLMRAIHERAAQVGRQGILNRAISQLPRVEDRLLAFFWTLADHRGNVRPEGIWIDVPLTHDELGQLIGARRPTVSLGLHKLADAGHLAAEEDGFLLSHGSLEPFRSPREEDPSRNSA